MPGSYEVNRANWVLEFMHLSPSFGCGCNMTSWFKLWVSWLPCHHRLYLELWARVNLSPSSCVDQAKGKECKSISFCSPHKRVPKPSVAYPEVLRQIWEISGNLNFLLVLCLEKFYELSMYIKIKLPFFSLKTGFLRTPNKSFGWLNCKEIYFSCDPSMPANWKRSAVRRDKAWVVLE